jgi:hypothetical protein
LAQFWQQGLGIVSVTYFVDRIPYKGGREEFCHERKH